METEKSSLEKWAEKEIELACKRADSDNIFDTYARACYKNTLEAFKIFLGVDHSGRSVGYVGDILNRLINQQPLTPIEDTPDSWRKISDIYCDHSIYQHLRLPSFFKYIYFDGKIVYRDANRVRCTDIDGASSIYQSDSISKLIDELYPITMPYYPTNNHFMVYVDDTRTPRYLIRPDGEKVEME